ncbi:uncharacterized protein K452DRAFT_344372 [Aplosporella prunicola CBS 121167]|uniref:Uncharacterized protein n=1 Tax=Aplosporella prunicola CBS 121167 TaxID=1176127 RepID=A0A6A6AYS4_9PEZI|nr:uncharacterized protein K452DRAFT_344372 [Aplosporella prunicola CBS 121167]KAF2136154.1 hypothetical protein K452DRAFT_344372 [Aplosporella prunicola CBS 121167]
MATQAQVLAAFAKEPIEDALTTLTTCTDPPTDRQLAEVAVENSRVDLIEHLLGKGNPTWLFNRKDIVRKQSKPMIEALIRGGWDITENLGGYCGCPLALAIFHRAPVSFLAWLLARGADPNGEPALVDHHGYPLRLAAMLDDTPPETRKLLLDYGADVNFSKALHQAVRIGHFDFARLLVEEYGADVNADDFDPDWICPNSTWENGQGRPLHYAARNGDFHLVTYLLEKGASIDPEDPNGYTPRMLAELAGHSEVRTLLAQREAGSGKH